MKKYLILIAVMLIITIPVITQGYVRTFSLGDEFLLDTNIVYIPAPFDQTHPSVAFGGNNYLVVWQDERTEEGIGYAVYAARVNLNGQLLDSAGLQITTRSGSEGYPLVAFDGTNYLVTWRESRGICGMRVDTSGKSLDSTGFLITGAYTNHSIAFGGNNYLLVWGWGWDISAKRVDTQGKVLDSADIQISTDEDYQGTISVASSDTNFLVVWAKGVWYKKSPSDTDSVCYYNIYGARVDTSGKLLDTSKIAISTGTHNKLDPGVAFDGTNYFVVWYDYRNDSLPAPHYNIYGARVSPSGVVLDTEGIPISTKGYYNYRHSIVFGGGKYLIVWGSQILGTMVNTSGTALTSDIVISNRGMLQYPPAVASGGNDFLVVWENAKTGANEMSIYGSRVSSNGVVLDPSGILVSSAAYYQETPSVAFGDSNYFVAWSDHRNNIFDIYGSRVGLSGNVLEPQGINISKPAAFYEYPCVSFCGQNYLTMCINIASVHNIYGARVAKDGMGLDPQMFSIPSTGYSKFSHSLASDGTNYFVVWETNANIYGALVSSSGTVLDSNILISTSNRVQIWPSVTFNGNNYLVAWSEGDNFGVAQIDIYCTRVTKDGMVLDSNEIPVSVSPSRKALCSMTSGDGSCLALWQYRDDNSWDVFGARIDTSGVVLDTECINISKNNLSDQMEPFAAFDGKNYLVVWQDNRNKDWDIYGARIDSSGTVIDTFPVSAQKGAQFSPRIASGPDRELFITWSGWVSAINGKPANTMRTWGKICSFTGIEENADFGFRNAELKISRNPFLKSTVISYYLPAKSKVSLSLYDLAGRCVKTLIDGEKKAGSYSITLSAKELKSGVYFVKLSAGTFKETKKLILIK